MTSSSFLALPLPETAVLLVLLPARAGATPSAAALQALQHRLGAAVRVLPISEALHPTVVRSFAPPALPACVLMRQGVELWRRPGLPDDEASMTALLRVAQAPFAKHAGEVA